MATSENLIPIPGRLHSVATEGHVSGADEIFDDSLNKDQATINQEVNAALGEGGTVDEKIAEAIDNALEDVAYIDPTESSPAVVPGFDPTTDTVHVTAQVLSESQKAQVRTNIGLGDVDAKINQAVASEASQRAAGDSSLQSNISAEASRAQAAESNLQQLYEALTQSDIEVVNAVPASGVANKIYRVVGENSYSDYMFNSSDLNTPIKMAEYDNAIDDVPTANSNNLVKSGGVEKITGEGFNNIYPIKLEFVFDKENYCISGAGAPVSATGYCYVIYDVSEVRRVSIDFDVVALGDAILWATYSQLQGGDIDSTYMLRSKVWPQSLYNQPSNEVIDIDHNEKYLVISNRITNYNINKISASYTKTLTSEIKKIDEVTGNGLNVYSEIDAIKTADNKAISITGGAISASGFSYKVYDVSELGNLNIKFQTTHIGYATLWATYSQLNNGDIDSQYLVRNKIWPTVYIDQPCDETIHFSSNEKYIAISNSTANYEDDGIKILEESNLTEIIKGLIPKFTGENIVVLGDSLTYMGGDNCNDPSGWTKWFKDKANAKSMKSYARSGATWTNTANTVYDIVEDTGMISDDNVIYNQINRVFSAFDNDSQPYPDLVIISAGTNDAWYPHHRPDVLSKTVAEVFSQETLDSYITTKAINAVTSLAESVRYNVEMLIQKFPETRIVLLTPLQSTAFTVERRNAVAEIIVGCAEQMGLQSVRQDNECGIYRVQESVSFYNTIDGTHTSVRGAEKVGNILLQIIH